MRGKGYQLAVLKHGVGITPAYAGKSLPALWISSFSPDHPRLCGEKMMPERQDDGGLGSPPPMRGKD